MVVTPVSVALKLFYPPFQVPVGCIVDISDWLRELDLDVYADVFRANAIDADVLQDLSDADLENMGVLLGHRRKLLRAIAALDSSSAEKGFTVSGDPAERRQVTIMFADLVGSTALTHALDPEEVREILSAYRQACGAAVAAHGGHVAKFLGDGVLAYFGWPEAFENAAERGVRASIDLAAAVDRIERNGRRLAARVGLATGPVVIGDLVGEGVAREHSVVGQAPNLAARLQTLAAPGQVVISDLTRTMLGGLFEFRDLGARSLNGFEMPERVHAVLGEASIEDRFVALRGATPRPIIGRSREIERLVSLWREARRGAGRVVLIEGEAGIGKSRTLRALRDRIGQETESVWTFACAPHLATSALVPVTAQLRRRLCIEGDQPGSAFERLRQLLADRGIADPDAAPLLGLLIGIDGVSVPEGLTAERRRARTLELLVDLLEAEARGGRLLIVFEDLHWMDATTADFVDAVIDRIAEMPALMVLTQRPGAPAPRGERPCVETLPLDRLDPDEARALVESVAGKPLPGRLLELIVGRGDGVPLFVEEMTKTLLESDAVEEVDGAWRLAGPPPELAVPSTLHDSLIARLDRLGPAKEVAQIAAALGRAFEAAIVERIMNWPAEKLREALVALEGAGLVARQDAGVWLFKHALLRDAAYESLLLRRRRELHGRIADLLAEGRLDSVSALAAVGHHRAKAERFREAAEAWLAAGRLSLGEANAVEAKALFDRARSILLEEGLQGQDKSLLLSLNIALGEAAAVSDGYASPVAGEAFEAALELSSTIGDREATAKASHGLTLFHMDAGRHRRALSLAERFLDAAGEDRPKQVLGHRLVGTCQKHLGDFASAVRHFETGLALLESAPETDNESAFIHQTRVPLLGLLGMSGIVLGRPWMALNAVEDAVTVAEQSGHVHSIAFGLHTQIFVSIRARQLDALQSSAEALRALSERHSMTYHHSGAMCGLGVAARFEHDIERAIRLLSLGIAEHESTGARYILPYWLVELGEALLESGARDAAQDAASRAWQLIGETEEKGPAACILRLKALLAENASERLGLLREGIALAEHQQAWWWRLRLATDLAEEVKKQGDDALALATLKPVVERFEGERPLTYLDKARLLLEEMNTSRGLI